MGGCSPCYGAGLPAPVGRPEGPLFGVSQEFCWPCTRDFLSHFFGLAPRVFDISFLSIYLREFLAWLPLRSRPSLGSPPIGVCSSEAGSSFLGSTNQRPARMGASLFRRPTSFMSTMVILRIFLSSFLNGFLGLTSDFHPPCCVCHASPCLPCYAHATPIIRAYALVHGGQRLRSRGLRRSVLWLWLTLFRVLQIPSFLSVRVSKGPHPSFR